MHLLKRPAVAVAAGISGLIGALAAVVPAAAAPAAGGPGGTGSVPGGTGVTFSFVNRSSADVEIYYLEPNDSAAPEDTIGAGGQFSPSTTTDTEWMVGNASGGCLGIFQIDGGGAVSVS
jgi:hypothetical protein